MTTLLIDPVVHPSTDPSQRLRTTMAAVRVSLSWLGVRKTLSSEQKAQAANTFGAEGEFLSAGKKLLDTRHPKFKAVTAVKNRVTQFWKSLSLPYPENGVRLIRQDKIDAFFKARYDAMVDRIKVAAKSFIDEAAALPGAVKTPSGMVFVESEPGTGESPGAADTVKLHYHGTLPDGTVFDSSRQRGEPASFRLDQVIELLPRGVPLSLLGELHSTARAAAVVGVEHGEALTRGKLPRA